MTVHTLHSLQHGEGPQSVEVFLNICHWVFLAFNRGKGIWDLLNLFIFLFELELLLFPVHCPSGLRALPEALRCVLSFSCSLSKPNTLFWFSFLAPQIPVSMCTMEELSPAWIQSSLQILIFVGALEKWRCLILMTLKQLVKTKMMCRREGKLGQVVESCRKVLGEADLPCLHVLMAQRPKSLFSWRFLWSVAWFD